MEILLLTDDRPSSLPDIVAKVAAKMDIGLRELFLRAYAEEWRPRDEYLIAYQTYLETKRVPLEARRFCTRAIERTCSNPRCGKPFPPYMHRQEWGIGMYFCDEVCARTVPNTDLHPFKIGADLPIT